MDHQEAIRLQAAEKYLLGELVPELREQFEEHYFDCQECAGGLRDLGAFVTASRLVLKEDVPAQIAPQLAGAERPSWFRWLRAPVAVPAITILGAILVFQNVYIIPSLRRQAATGSFALVYESSYRLQGVTRGGNVSRVTLGPGESFALEFDFTPTRTFRSYSGKLVDSAGASVVTFGLTSEQDNKELHLVIPSGKVHPGNYELIVSGENGNLNQGPKSNEVLRIPLVVAAQP
jgi:hypothetical protein